MTEMSGPRRSRQTQRTMNNCRFVLAHGVEPPDNADAQGNKVEQHVMGVIYCERPAPIKYEGLYYCAEHFDEIHRAANCFMMNGFWHYFSCAEVCA